MFTLIIYFFIVGFYYFVVTVRERTFESLGQFFREQHVGQFALAVRRHGRVTRVVVYVVEVDSASCGIRDNGTKIKKKKKCHVFKTVIDNIRVL